MSHIKNSFFLLLFFLNAVAIMAQDAVTLNATLDKRQLLIGEQATLIIEASIAGNAPIRFVEVDSIAHFEILSDRTDTIYSGSETVIRGVYTITSFDSGHWVIPSYRLGKAATDTIPVDIMFTPDFDPGQDYHDIKDILEAPPSKKESKTWWYIAGGLLILALFIILWFLRKKKPVEEKPVAAVNAYDEAIKALAALEQGKPEAKEFHSRLTDIFRLYVFRKKGILSLQKTTDDLVAQLKGIGLPREKMEQLSRSLQLSDFVKFARYSPSQEDDRSVFITIKNSIEAIEKTTDGI